MKMLSSADTFVFDCGAEMYIWHGKEVSFNDRQLAVKLGRALWDQGYDYTHERFCPFLPNHKASVDVKGPRPEWGLFARVTENLETALIQEKFSDWSNIHREIGEREELLRETSRGETAKEMKTRTAIKPDMCAYDVTKMHNSPLAKSKLHFEGYDVWNGNGPFFGPDGRGHIIHTKAVDVSYIKDKAMSEVKDDIMLFHRGDTYAVRWTYFVSSTGKFEFAGNEHLTNKNSTRARLSSGRERKAYFLWMGKDSSINEKGASALLAAETKGQSTAPVVVSDGNEPVAMGKFFDGTMMVVDGKHGKRSGSYRLPEDEITSSWKLLSIRGSSTEDVIFYQTTCTPQSLRSTSSFIAFNGGMNQISVWHGCRSSPNMRKIAEYGATLLSEKRPKTLGFRSKTDLDIDICEEGSESKVFMEAILRMRREKYHCLLEKPAPRSPLQTRIWHFTRNNDEFVAQPLPSIVTSSNDDVISFPYIQSQLSSLDKPALILLENEHGVYLWEGVPVDELKGSAKRLHDVCKRLAMETTLNYCEKYRPDCEEVLYIHENNEPLQFTNSFPIWVDHKDKKSLFHAAPKAKKSLPISKVLSTISRLTYTLEELRAKPLPDGVDPNHLETYLSIKDFEDLFAMSKEDFYKLPAWKQSKLRKDKSLF